MSQLTFFGDLFEPSQCKNVMGFWNVDFGFRNVVMWL
jgi:hypothetical protein